MDAYDRLADELRNAIDPTWCVVEPRFRRERNQHYESNFTTGSGYLSARGVPEEGADGYPTLLGTFVPGIYARNPHFNTEVVNLPAFWGLGLSVDGQRLGMRHSRTRGYRRWLDLRDGTLRRTVVWNVPGRAAIGLVFERFVSLADPHLALQRLTLVADADVEVVVSPSIVGNVTTSGWDHFTRVEPRRVDAATIEVAVTTSAGDRIVTVSALAVDGARAGRSTYEPAPRDAVLSVPLRLKANRPCTVTKATAVYTGHDLEGKPPAGAARAHARRAARAGWEPAYTAHARAWDRRWREMDVAIEGDDDCLRGLRFSMFHMVRSHADDPRVSIDAKCYTSDGYRGRIFWDTEVYMLPFFIYSDPHAARQLVEYRHRTLDGARQKAKDYCYEGAMYPWESAVTGNEEVHLWEHAWCQIHITGEVAYGVWHYLEATGDDAFFRRCAAEIVIEAARFWASRAKKRFDSDRYEIRFVIGPDEYTQFIHNNYHTNFIAGWTMRRAVDCLHRLRTQYPGDYRRLCRRLGIDRSIERRLLHIADKLILPYDKKRDLILMDPDFDHRAPFDVAANRKHKGHWHAFMSSQQMIAGQGHKQADVCVTMNLFPDAFTDRQKKIAYQTYEPITTHDSSLSRSSYAVVAADMGDVEEAYRQSREAIDLDLDPEKRRATGGLHAACQGAVWYVTTRAFAGMRVRDGQLLFAPRLPKAWKRLAFQVHFRGRKIGVELTKRTSTFTLLRGEPLKMLVHGREHTLRDTLTL